MVSSVSGIIDCLNTDFKYFCKPALLEAESKGKENEQDRFLIRHTKYNWQFNHESFNIGEARLYDREKWEDGPTTFVNNNFEKLVERYTKRIDNFKYYCESGYYVTFILQLPNRPGGYQGTTVPYLKNMNADEVKDCVDQLNTAIRNRFSELKFEIKIIPWIKV
jgi:hypothetical protein